ncbi:MAG: hypothetical protein KDA87_08840, partial [Planctomycetales bacterium]|nr:hypothetical protein [Planctomycetales bacterium]
HSITSGIQLNSGRLNVHSDLETSSLVLENESNLLLQAPLTVTDFMDLRNGNVDASRGSIRGVQAIQKTTPGHVNIYGLGSDFAGELNLHEGSVNIFGTQAIGSGTINVLSSNVLLNVQADDQLANATVRLNNAQLNSQGTAVFQAAAFGGTLDLGDQGSVLTPAQSMRLAGPVVGGDLDLRTTELASHLILSSPGVAYTGRTRIHGGIQLATLSLEEQASLISTSGIELDRATLELHAGATNRNRIGDAIPITMSSSRLEVFGGDERIGHISAVAGRNQVVSTSSQVRIQSLEIDTASTMQFQFDSPQGLRISNWSNTPFLGSHVVTFTDQLRFGKYDQVEGILPLADETMNTGEASSWNTTDHVGVRSAVVSNSVTVESMTMINDIDPANVTINDQAVLTIESGGVILSSSGRLEGPGRITAGGAGPTGTLWFHTEANDSASVLVNISDHPGQDGLFDPVTLGPLDADNRPVSVVFSGGYVELYGANSYSGQTHIFGADVMIRTPSALANSPLAIRGGSLSSEAVPDVQFQLPTVRLTDGTLAGDFLVTEEFWIDSGVQRGNIEGPRITKASDGLAVLYGVQNFTGTLDVQEGMLRLMQPLTEANVVVHTGARLEVNRSVPDKLTLAGGSLVPIFGSGTMEASMQSQLVVTQDSTIGGFWHNDGFLSQGSVQIESGVTLALEGIADSKLTNLDLQNGSKLSLMQNGTTMIEGHLQVGGVAGIEIAESANLIVGNNARLVAQTPDSRLHIDFAQGLAPVKFRNYVAGPGTSLAMLVNGEKIPFVVEGAGSTLEGSGQFQQPVQLLAGGTISPGDQGTDNSIGHLRVAGNLDSQANSTWLIEMRNAVGAPGVDWDAVTVDGQISVSTSPPPTFVFQATEANGIQFDPRQPYRWQFANGNTNHTGTLNANIVTAGFSAATLPFGAAFSVISEPNGLYLVYQVLLGDFSGNGVLDVADIDQLNQQIRSGQMDLAYDLTNDGLVNAADRVDWVRNLGNTYFGDANFDGEFNSSDLVQIFTANTYEQGLATWATGDWNGDGRFTSADLVAAFQDGGFELGPRTALQAVPEPSSLLLWLPLVLCLSKLRLYVCQR